MKSRIQDCEWLRTGRLAGISFIALLSLTDARMCRAATPDYVMENETVPDSVENLPGNMDYGFTRETRPEHVFTQVQDEIEEKLPPLPDFFRDTDLKLRVRSYYFDRNNASASDNLAWALGGWVDYLSGWAFGRFRLGATWYTLQKLYGPKDKDGTLLLKPDQSGFDVLGQAFAEVKLGEGTMVRVFRQAFDFPYLNRRDDRMVPVTYEAYVIEHKLVSPVDWVVGHVRKIKPRDSHRFRSMSEAAGADGTDDGLTMAGLHYRMNEHIDIGLIEHYAWNVMNTLYVEGNAVIRAEKELPLRFSLQYTDQRSIGSAWLGYFQTRHLGTQLSVSWQGLIVSVAGSWTDENRGIFKPYGGSPSYLSSMIADFDRAGESAWGIAISYDLQDLDWLNGLSLFILYARGYPSTDAPDQAEWDVTLDFRPTRGKLEGL